MNMRTDDKREDIGKPQIVREMLRDYKLSAESEEYNRERAIEAIKFAKGEQWAPTVLADRTAYNLPSEVYNQIPQFVHQVTNDLRMNMPQTTFVPEEDADKEKAEIREDLVRSIQTSSEGEVAYDTAASNAVIGGWGYWRYLTKYENPKTFDQVIQVGWIPNMMSVYDDPNATQQDRLDRCFLVHVYDMTKDDFNDNYDVDADGDPINYDDNYLRGLGSESPDWAGDKKVRVAEYWKRTVETTKLYRIKKTGAVSKEKPKGDPDTYDARDVEEYKVMWYKCTAGHILEQREWPGIYIPYVFVSGEAVLVDGKWTYDGIVRAMMGPQIQFNYAVNTAIYMASLAPKNQFIVDPAAIAGYEQHWNDANTVPTAYLPYRQFDPATGQQYNAPQRQNNGVDLSAAANLIQIAQQNFYNVTGIYPASLGQASNETSGKAITARQREGDTSTYHFGDNVARALRAGGRILDDLISKVYDGARTIKGVKEDGTTRDVVINKPFKDKDGTTKEYDMTTGTYGIVVSTGPGYSTKRQEMADAMNQLAPTLIGTYPAVGPEWIRAQDWPGADAIADAMDRSLPPQLQKPLDDEGIPPQVVNKLQQMGQESQQMQQVIQQMQGQLQQAEQALADKQADIQNKQADLELKKQQSIFNEKDAQRQAELDKDKNNLEREKMAFELLKLQVGNVTEEQGENEMPDMTALMQTFTSDENVLGAMMQSLAVKKQQEHENKEMSQQMEMQEQALKTQTAEQEMMNEQQKAVLAQAQLQKLDEIQGGLIMLTQAITAPKVVQRDPVTGMATGVVTVGSA